MEKIVSKNFGNPEARKIDFYLKNGGYESARKALSQMSPAQVIDEVKASNLRGLGGAGFPAGMKWGFIPKDSPKPKYVVVNADEGEPGTFKDKYIMVWDPHLLIEGIILAAYAIGSHKSYIYIRGEYVEQADILEAAIREAYDRQALGKKVLGSDFALDVVVHRGAGAYICGEETALLESIEGKKGWPRLKPPFPAVYGLFGCPTIINNVETLSYVPSIIKNGAAWFAKMGTEKEGGMRLFSVSGHVQRPGVYELPMGTSLRDIIYKHVGGIRDDRKLKAVVPGGMSAAVLAASEIDLPMSFDSLKRANSMLGSAGVIVMDETTCMVKALWVTAHFFAHESCGQCSPCREGTGWMFKILDRIYRGEGRPADVDNLLKTANNIAGTTICALGDAAAMPIQSYIPKFRSEFDHHVAHKSCDVEAVPALW